ncbi:MAG: CRTAC1 family protein, partial [Bacteroidetes bacterium]|nr:CRTAC1 family protein [Bacteroidota bacterium]
MNVHFRILTCLLTLVTVLPSQAQVFVNRTFDAGLDRMWQGNGVATADYDGDGWLDVYLVSRLTHEAGNARSWNRLYRNNRDGTFTETTLEAGVRVDFLPALPATIFGNKSGAAWGDYDRDGDPDLFLTHVGPEVLFRNNGDGTFTDVANEAGLNRPDAATDESETSGATWWDFDLDGYLDLYVSSWTGRNAFYRNNGNGTFTDIGQETGLDLEDRTWMSLPWDVDLDGWPDLYLANDFGPNRLFRNNGNGMFTDVTAQWGLGDEGESMGLALGDVSGDGWPDLFITNNAVRGGGVLANTFFLGAASGPLQDVAAQYGIENTDWAWGTEFSDLDLDGDLDLLVVNGAFLERNTPNRFFRNMTKEEGVFRFEDVSGPSGVDGRAESHGLLVFDPNNDGALDLLVTNWGEPLYFLVHPGPAKRWLKVGLRGVSTNPDGVGSRIRVLTTEGWQIRWHDGVDFLGQSIQPAHFGMGLATTYEAIEVTWPGGMTERFAGGATSTTVILHQGTGTAVGTERTPRTSCSDVVSAYPVPARDRVILEMERPTMWTIHDLLGKMVARS